MRPFLEILFGMSNSSWSEGFSPNIFIATCKSWKWTSHCQEQKREDFFQNLWIHSCFSETSLHWSEHCGDILIKYYQQSWLQCSDYQPLVLYQWACQDDWWGWWTPWLRSCVFFVTIQELQTQLVRTSSSCLEDNPLDTWKLQLTLIKFLIKSAGSMLLQYFCEIHFKMPF